MAIFLNFIVLLAILSNVATSLFGGIFMHLYHAKFKYPISLEEFAEEKTFLVLYLLCIYEPHGKMKKSKSVLYKIHHHVLIRRIQLFSWLLL